LVIAVSWVVGQVPDTGCESVKQCLLSCGGQAGAHFLLDAADCRAGRVQVIAAGLGECGGYAVTIHDKQ